MARRASPGIEDARQLSASATDQAPRRSLDEAEPGPHLHRGPTHNLPCDLTSFLGREAETAEVRRLLSTTRVLTLVGAGGVGKTRLGLRVASSLVEAFSDGVWLVQLASLTDGVVLPEAIAQVLGVRQQPGRALVDTLTDALRPGELLLVLDNCEHLATACARIAEDLLRACPRVKILVTSRETLAIAGETVWRVPSLSLPGSDDVPSDERLDRYEAILLFVERARAALPSFRLTDHNGPDVVRICRRLDGIPLAIELAANCVRGMSPDQIDARLDDRFRLLSQGSRTALPRHQTLSGAIGWSYDLLSEREQVLLQRLSVFAGGWTLEAAEGVCAGGGLATEDVLPLLLRLVDTSLVVAPEHQDARYGLLETIRQYAQTRLRESGAEAALRRRHRDWFLALAEQAAPKLRGADQTTWLAQLEREWDNLRAALTWTSTDDPDGEHLLRLADALGRFWSVRGHFAEGQRWVERALAGGGIASPARVRALDALGLFTQFRGEYQQTTRLREQAVALARELGERLLLAEMLMALAVTLNERGVRRATRPLLEESLDLFRALGVDWGIAQVLRVFGIEARLHGNDAEAVAVLTESLARCRADGDGWQIAWSAHHLGAALYAQGHRQRAEPLVEEGLALQRQIGDKRGIARSLLLLAQLANEGGARQRAARLLRESLLLNRELGYKRGMAPALHAAAVTARNLSDIGRVRLIAAAAGLRDEVGALPFDAERQAYERDLAAMRARLGAETFATAWAEGAALGNDRAIDCALAGLQPTTAERSRRRVADDLAEHPADGPLPSILTPREREVVQLIARGLTNRQLAAELVIAERTASAHLYRILGKLGFSSRAQVAAWAVRHGVVTDSQPC